MTVKQLIAELSKQDPHAIVLYANLASGKYMNVNFVTTEHVKPLRDSDIDDNHFGDYEWADAGEPKAVTLV